MNCLKGRKRRRGEEEGRRERKAEKKIIEARYFSIREKIDDLYIEREREGKKNEG